jgi:hypothetical protein
MDQAIPPVHASPPSLQAAPLITLLKVSAQHYAQPKPRYDPFYRFPIAPSVTTERADRTVPTSPPLPAELHDPFLLPGPPPGSTLQSVPQNSFPRIEPLNLDAPEALPVAQYAGEVEPGEAIRTFTISPLEDIDYLNHYTRSCDYCCEQLWTEGVGNCFQELHYPQCSMLSCIAPRVTEVFQGTDILRRPFLCCFCQSYVEESGYSIEDVRGVMGLAVLLLRGL